jgi:hypothetical protein
MVDFYKYFNGQNQQIACVARAVESPARHPGLDALFRLAVGAQNGLVSEETLRGITKIEAGIRMFPMEELQANQNLLCPEKRTIVAAVFPQFDKK